jgi:hypothetical protein
MEALRRAYAGQKWITENTRPQLNSNNISDIFHPMDGSSAKYIMAETLAG